MKYPPAADGPHELGAQVRLCRGCCTTRSCSRRVVLPQACDGLNSSSRAAATACPIREKLEGAHLRWRQRESDPPIDLYPGFSKEDKRRLRWRWDSSEHGGLMQGNRYSVSDRARTNRGVAFCSLVQFPW